MADYLKQLPLTVAEQDKLRSLAAPTAAALVALIRSSVDSFSRFFGADRTQQLLAWLTPLLSEDEHQRLAAPARAYPVQGVMFTEKPAPVLLPPDFDIAERDHLFDKLSRLRSQPQPTPEVQREITFLEKRLNEMLR